MAFELYQLEELVILKKEGTISRAAERFGVSQPAFSRSMRLLEKEFAIPIFHRTSNTISLNETGQFAALEAEKIVDAANRLLFDVRQFDRRKRTIFVGSEAPAPLWAVVSMLSEKNAEKAISGELAERKELVDGLKGGSYSSIITTTPVAEDGYSSLHLGEENLLFLLPATHPLASESVLSFSDLDGENMLLLENIGVWKGLPEKVMPKSRFFVQEDNDAFYEFVEKSTLPSFTSDLVEDVVEGKRSVKIKDKEAHMDYYITAESRLSASLSYLVKNFSREFARHKYIPK